MNHTSDLCARRRHAPVLAMALLSGVVCGALWACTADEGMQQAQGTPVAAAQGAQSEAVPQLANASPAAPNTTPALVAPPPVVDASLGATTEASLASAMAGVRGVTTLDHTNWELGKALLPEAVLKRVKNGEYAYTLVNTSSATLRQGYSQRFWEASAANAGRYDLDPATCGLKDVATGNIPDFYFGYPFPRIAPRDPQAACKMLWNFEAANAMGEGQDAKMSISGIAGNGELKRIRLWRRSVYYQGRHGGPIPNPEGLQFASMSGAIEPQDVDGVGSLTKRINSWTSEDQVWFYVPATRRVRRVNGATLSDPIAGIDAFGEDFDCFAGKIESYHWKLIGDGAVLAPVIPSVQLIQTGTGPPNRFEVPVPTLRRASETSATGAPWLIVDGLAFTPRPVWIVAGEPVSKYHNFGKIIMYMDKDLYRIYWKLVRNRDGQYFYNAMCASQTAHTADGGFSAVIHPLIAGVNDVTNRAGLIRMQSAFVDRTDPKDELSFPRCNDCGGW